MSEWFSLDILFTIFTHLPIKSLMRFRCVSKSCRSLIDSPEFSNSHLNHNNNSKLVLADCHLEGSIYVIDLDTSRLITPWNIKIRPKPSVETPDNFIPIKPDGVFGSCNGVVAMSNKQGISLWNPSTNRFKSFPLRIVDIQLDGFGYDSVSDDYKVIMATKLFSEDFLRVMIYSVKTNSLRRIQDLHNLEPFSTRLNYEHSGVLVGSFLHWVAYPRDETTAYHNFVLAFDLRDETFHQVPQPRDTTDGENKELVGVSELGGCLSLSYGRRNIAIWIMNEYGIEDSWTKLLSMNSPTLSKPLVYSKEGDEVLFDYNNGTGLILYDLKNRITDRIAIFEFSEYRKMSYWKSAFVCASTLAFPLVNGGSSNGSCKKMSKKKKSEKA